MVFAISRFCQNFPEAPLAVEKLSTQVLADLTYRKMSVSRKRQNFLKTWRMGTKELAGKIRERYSPKVS